MLGNASDILRLSPCSGRVTKKASRSLLSKVSFVDSFNEVQQLVHQSVPLTFDEEESNSTSGCESPESNSSEGEDGTGEKYEYAICSTIGCCFKFCVKCRCKYHPRVICPDFSPPSPARVTKSPAARKRASKRSLKRLFKS